jgi:Mg-chelatase subunit ChlD
MKPECELCKEEKRETFSSIFGEHLTEEVVYKLFNLDLVSRERFFRDLQIENLIRSYLESFNSKSMEYQLERYMRWLGIDQEKIEEYLKTKEAWEKLVEKIKKGEINPSDLSAEELIRTFPSQVTEELAKEELLSLKVYSYRLYPHLLMVQPEFTEKSEKIIAKKVLEEAFLNLRKQSVGIHEVDETGFGISSSHILHEFDEFQHTYDMLDIQETLISTAIRDPVNLEISKDDLKARIPIHKAKSSNVILIDSSYSMRGVKFRGGIMAALALKELLQTEYKEDKLFIVAYNHKPQILASGEIIKLKPYGYTDIGLALEFSLRLLLKEEGNKNIFLITDGEPTATHRRNQTPEESAFRAAYIAGKMDVSLNIIMLDYRPELRFICEKMVRLNGNATLTHVRNPLNLKEFIIKSFVDRKKRGVKL